MIYGKYFERYNREHISLSEWENAVNEIDNLQLAKDTIGKYNLWIGYRINPNVNDNKQFHNRIERKYDAELFINNQWRRVFYCHLGPSKKWGVIIYEGGVLSGIEDVIEETSKKLCEILNSRIRGEDETWYED